MNSLGYFSRLILVVLLGFPFGAPKIVQAQDDMPDEFTVHTEKGERRIEGTIKGINAEHGSFEVTATMISYPSGLPHELANPLSVVVTTRANTFGHVRGHDDWLAAIDKMHAGDSVVVIATYLAATQRWTASGFAVWSKKEKDGYSLDGYVPTEIPNPNAPKLDPLSKTLAESVGYPTPEGFVTSWTGDAGEKDTTGKHPARLQNGVGFAPGVVGNAISFDGADDHFSIPDAPEFLLTKSFTCEGWLFVSSVDQDALIFIRGDNREGWDPLAVSVLKDKTLRFHVGSEFANCDLETKIEVGKWVYFAATLDDAKSVMRIYLNGKQVAEKPCDIHPMGGLSEADGAGIGLGNSNALPTARYNFPFHGLIDEWSLYSRALTIEEIRGIYNAGRAGKLAPKPAA